MNKRLIFKIMIMSLAMMVTLFACQAQTVEEDVGTAVATQPPTITAPTETPEPVEEEPTSEPTQSLSPTPTPEPGVARTFAIVPEQSEVRFFVDERLFGEPKTVVGRTSQISGTIQVDLNRPDTAEVSPIEINARDLTTDSSFRNRALRNQILDSAEDAYQFITFTPTAIDGLAGETAVSGQLLTFNLTGDLQIRDITHAVTFLITATAVSETELNGFGVVTVQRSDYDLIIPSVTGVADVSDDVRLEIDFVAVSTEESYE